MCELSPNGNKLYDLMLEIPPDFARIKQELATGKYTKDDISMAATKFVDDACWGESPYEESEEPMAYVEPVLVQGLNSTYLYDLVSLLLEYGLDPNAVCDDTNIMDRLKHIENEYVGADTLALLLDHGGDFNLQVEERSLLSLIDFDVTFDAFEQRDRRKFDALIHCWLVFIGFGAKLEDGSPVVEVFENHSENNELDLRDFEISDLKNHRNFIFGLSHVHTRGKSWSLHIFDKRTCWEVARL